MTSIKTPSKEDRDLVFSLLVIGQVIKAPVHTSSTQQGHSIQVGKDLQQDFWGHPGRGGKNQRGRQASELKVTQKTTGCSPPNREQPAPLLYERQTASLSSTGFSSEMSCYHSPHDLNESRDPRSWQANSLGTLPIFTHCESTGRISLSPS